MRQSRRKGNSSSSSLWLQFCHHSGCRLKPVLNHIQTYTYTLTSWGSPHSLYFKVRPNEIGLSRLSSRHRRHQHHHHRSRCCYTLCNHNIKQWLTFYWLCHCHFKYDRKSQSTSFCLQAINCLILSSIRVCVPMLNAHANIQFIDFCMWIARFIIIKSAQKHLPTSPIHYDRIVLLTKRQQNFSAADD